MKRVLLLIALVVFSVLLNAQEELCDGYIISNQGDTISGKLSYQGDIRNSKECILHTEGKVQKKYQPFEIDGYMFHSGKYYISKYIIKTDTILKVFAEYLVKGQKDLFLYRDHSGFHYLINYNDSSLIEIPYKQEISVVDGKAYMRESTIHIGILKAYFSDCPSIYSQIENLKKPDTKELISITKEYHKEVCGENSCIVYQKQKKPLRIAIELRVAPTKAKGQTDFVLQKGGLIYLCVPSYNEYIYLKSGLLYEKYPNSISMYRIPFHIEYLFPKKLIRPKFSIGVNVYSLNSSKNKIWMGLNLAASGGCLIQLSDSFYTDIFFETEFLQCTLDPKFFMSYTFGIGAYFRF